MAGRGFTKSKVHFITLRRHLAVIVLSLAFAGCSSKDKGPVSFQSPPDWKVEWKKNGSFNMYALTTPTAGQGLLMFAQWPPPNRADEIPALVEKLAEQFKQQARMSSGFQLASEHYTVEPLAGRHCQGNFAIFRVNAGSTEIVQAMFLMDIDGRIWSGQFTGSTDSWTQALTVLKSIRKN